MKSLIAPLGHMRCVDFRLPMSCLAPKQLYAENLSSIFLFAFTMGSPGKFDPIICHRCEQEFVAVYPPRWRCKQCTVLSIHQFVLYKVTERIGDTSLTFLLVPFLCFDYDRGARKHYLWMALLARDSLFRMFTWSGSEWLFGRYSRKAGNISWTYLFRKEDIVDRICSFV